MLSALSTEVFVWRPSGTLVGPACQTVTLPPEQYAGGYIYITDGNWFAHPGSFSRAIPEIRGGDTGIAVRRTLQQAE